MKIYNYKLIFLFFCLNVYFSMPFPIKGVEDTSLEDSDPLKLAALLIKNKNYSRAQSVLSKIKDPHEVIPEKYWSLKGVLELRQKRFDKAEVSLKAALKEGAGIGQESQEVFLGLSEAYLGQKKYREGIKLLIKKEKVTQLNPRHFQLLSSLYFGKGEGEKAWSVLHQGIKNFSNFLPLMKQKWFYLVENNLLEVSFSVGKNLVDSYQLSALDVARMGQMYRQKNDYDKALYFGEVARLKDSKDEEIVKDLARSYLKKENISAAAQLFTTLSKHQPKFLVEASELWRKAGYPVHAERLVLEIRDPVKKMKQGITLALFNEDFNKMALLGKRAQRTSLKQNQDIQYALAYANFMLGNYSSVNEYLKYIQREDLFKKVVALREAIESCQGDTICL